MSHIKIEQMEEEEKVYYLATSDEIQGLTVQADTLSECIEIVEESVKELIDTNKKLGNPIPIHTAGKEIVEIKNFTIPFTVPA